MPGLKAPSKQTAGEEKGEIRKGHKVKTDLRLSAGQEQESGAGSEGAEQANGW